MKQSRVSASNWDYLVQQGLRPFSPAGLEESRQRMTGFLKDQARFSPQDTIVDHGCGNGGFSEKLAEETGADVVGLEVSGELADEARKNDYGNLTVLETDGYDWLEENGEVQAVTAVNVLHESTRERKPVDNFSDVSKALEPDAPLLVTLPSPGKNGIFPVEEDDRGVQYTPGIQEDGWRQYYLGEERVREIADETGLRIKDGFPVELPVDVSAAPGLAEFDYADLDQYKAEKMVELQDEGNYEMLPSVECYLMTSRGERR